MPQEIRVWKVAGDRTLTLIQKAQLSLEQRLENWLRKDISILSDDLMTIGQQVSTGFGGRIDLLCLDHEGDLVIVELKRDKTPREVVAQILDYASWIKDLSNDDITEIANNYLGDNGPLEKAFRIKFNDDLPETLNSSHKLLIVSSEMDSSSERIVKYLSETHGVRINTANFQYHRDENGTELLAKVFLIDPKEVDEKSRGSKRHHDDDIDQFMRLVKNKLPNFLSPELMPSKSSRWAGIYGTQRYYYYWYDSEPWDYTHFCFGTELETDKGSDNYRSVYISFFIDKSYANSSITPTKTEALLQLMRKLDRQNGFSFKTKSYWYYIVKRLEAETLSEDEASSVAKELAWVISTLLPEIRKVLVTS